jgi:DNA-binding transcriptional MerR regulator
MTVALRFYTINDVADYVGVHSHAIVLAEKERRVPVARRDELGARIYTEQDRDRIGTLMGRR